METKRIEDGWQDKNPTGLTHNAGLTLNLDSIDNDFLDAQDLLTNAGEAGFSYSTQRSEIEKIGESLGALAEYISGLHGQMDRDLDDPFYKSFVNDATEYMSRIKLENFKTANTLGIEREDYISEYGQNYYYKVQPRELGFAAFLGLARFEQHNLEGNYYVEAFADLFAAQYEVYAELANPEDLITEREYFEYVMTQGEFEHKMDKFWEQFGSDLLDITIVKPIIEMCTGEDLITGEDLSELERALEGVTAVCNIITFGQAGLAAAAAGGGAKTILLTLGKTALVEVVTDGAVMLTSAAALELGLPNEVALLLSMGTGLLVSRVGTKWIVEDLNGVRLAEVEVKNQVVDDLVTDNTVDASLNAAGDGIQTLDVNGKTVTMNNNTFDPDFVDPRGRTNIQRMEQGLAPIGYDGKSVNIHHIDQTDAGPVMEITATEHQQRYVELHPNTGQLPSQIDRAAFDKWRREYWRWRSTTFK
jgi:hypothetical protein